VAVANQSNITGVGTISSGTWQGTAIASTYIAADAITGAKIADNAIDSEHYTDGSIDNAHIADNAIDSEHYADGSIDNAHIADDAIDSEHYADGSIDNAHIADDAIDSEHYAAGSIDTAHLAADVITGAKIADDAIDSEHYTDGSIDAAHIAADAVTAAKIGDDVIDSEHYTDASVDFAHIQNVAANSILGRDANSSGVLSEVALATTQILIGDGTGFTPAALSGDATMTNAGVVTVASAAGNFTMGDTGQIIFSDLAPSSDHTASGIVITSNAGSSVGIFDAVYIHSDGELHSADADAVTSMPAIGISLEAKGDGEAMKVLTQGVLRDDTYNFTPGADIFVSTTAGDITATAPSGSGDTVQKIGVALTADSVYFNFNTTEILLA